jgi:A/G-specific adenine glycosylase
LSKSQSKEATTSSLPDAITKRWLSKFQSSVLSWYQSDGRDLPWRLTHDPYCIMVSEIMLQQTQASTVIPYYERFLKQFPTVNALAAADEVDVLSQWEGLGYYRRARMLHAAAKAIVERHDGQFPEDYSDIQALPGVGRYTAGAIASFAFNQRRPIVEANTQRLYSRLMALDVDLQTATAQATLWQFADAILPDDAAGTMNHALMDLGATICKPKNPSCVLCPVQSLCPTFEKGMQDQIPRPKRRVAFVDHFEIAVALQDDQGRLLMWQRPDDGWWAGLWDFPRTSVAKDMIAGKVDFANWFHDKFGADVELKQELEEFRHSVTHHRIVCRLFRGEIRATSSRNDVSKVREIANSSANEAGESKPKAAKRRSTGGQQSVRLGENAGKWVTFEELQRLPLSSSGRKMFDWFWKNG